MAPQADLLPGTLDLLILKAVSLGSPPRLRYSPAHPADFRRRAAHRTRRALPRIMPSASCARAF